MKTTSVSYAMRKNPMTLSKPEEEKEKLDKKETWKSFVNIRT